MTQSQFGSCPHLDLNQSQAHVLFQKRGEIRRGNALDGTCTQPPPMLRHHHPSHHVGCKTMIFFIPGPHKQLLPSKAHSGIPCCLLELHTPHLMFVGVVSIQIDHPFWAPRSEDPILPFRLLSSLSTSC